MLGRRPFRDVISRQLDVFAEDEADRLLAEVQEMKRRYDQTDRDEAEEAYGDYVDAVDAVKDALAEMRDRFAATLDEDSSERYEPAFEDAARRRWRWLA
ncbi:MAG TPA: hypothetical protein VKR79_05425 [Gaiellaceae bacterium]|nr:hypothetical protein [Gaiellaceae bacterium]